MCWDVLDAMPIQEREEANSLLKNSCNNMKTIVIVSNWNGPGDLVVLVSVVNQKIPRSCENIWYKINPTIYKNDIWTFSSVLICKSYLFRLFQIHWTDTRHWGLNFESLSPLALKEKNHKWFMIEIRNQICQILQNHISTKCEHS